MHTEFTHTVTVRGGDGRPDFPVKITLWNATVTDIAHHFECDEDEVEISEDEDGNEIVFVKGAEVGKLEWF